MGRSVWNQVDTSVYFSLSTIDRHQIKAHELNLRIEDLREAARRSKPYKAVYTGEWNGRVRKTNLYRYEDFRDLTRQIS